MSTWLRLTLGWLPLEFTFLQRVNCLVSDSGSSDSEYESDSDEWLIGATWALKMLSLWYEDLAPQSIHPIDASRRLSRQLSTDIHRHLYIVANLGLVSQNYSLKFALKKIIPLEDWFILSNGAFLQEENKLGIFSHCVKILHQSGGG